MNITNRAVLDWIEECKELMNPDNVVWVNGSKEQKEALRAEACSTGELIKLNEELLPGCYYHRSDKEDVARVEGRTFICCEKEEDAGPSNNYMSPKEAQEKVLPLFKGAMKGRTMYVIPHSMGLVGSPFSKIGVEVTDSIYVALSMMIMTRVRPDVYEELERSGSFIKCLHAKATLSKEDRYILHFPEREEIWSVNSGYGGNALLGKKCFALRIASTIGKREGWLAEHMLIVGIQNPKGEIKYVAGAFPSACGKTNLAMLIPPEGYEKDGWKVWCVGDDIAWIRIAEDGRMYATNPEYGFFGVAPGTSKKSNYNALMSASKNTIFTNVVRNLDNNTVWWEGMDKNPPENGEDWLGNPWNGKTAGTKGAHPNSRFTAPAKNCPAISKEFDNKAGVPISAIIFGGRRAKVAPLVYQSMNWQHGVFIGSSMASETTAAATGDVGIVRRDPMAMRPFCGYNMGDYFSHWLEMGKKASNPPKIFHVNWFRQGEDGDFIWPGFGENLRVLRWILDRCDEGDNATSSPIGHLPSSLDFEGLELDDKTVEALFHLDLDEWRKEASSIEEFYKTFDKLPTELKDELNALKERLK